MNPHSHWLQFGLNLETIPWSCASLFIHLLLYMTPLVWVIVMVATHNSSKILQGFKAMVSKALTLLGMM